MKKMLALLCAVVLVFSVVGCTGQSGGGGSTSGGTTTGGTTAGGTDTASQDNTSGGDTQAAEPDRSPITIDVFNQYANFHGIQSGWFATILKEKYNIEANIISPNVAGGGDTLYQTRSASGSLGDLIFLDNANSKIDDSIRVNLFLDMKENGLLDTYGANVLQYPGAIEKAQKQYNTGDKVLIIPMQVSNLTPLDPQDGKFLNNGSFIRWELYRELGNPAIKDFDALLDMLKEMQTAHPTADNGKSVYGISLFKDWDGVLLNNPANFSYMTGEEIIADFAVIRYSDYSITDIFDRNAGYMKGIEFFNKAHRMGLLDPDSPTQNFDTLRDKVQNGQILYVFWPWLGTNYNNVNNNKQEGRGFAPVAVESQKLIATGSTPSGQFRNVGIGSKTKYPERMMELLDWIYSPEYAQIANAGIEGIMWYIDENGEPVQTDFLDAMGDDTVMPAEYGGGRYLDGVSQLTALPLAGTAINPRTNQPYNPELWPTTLINRQFKVDTDWQDDMGALTQKEYVIEHNQITVVPGTEFEAPTPSSDLQNKINQISAVAKDNMWKMLFTNTDEEFNALYDDMVNKAKALGYDEVYEFYKAAAEEKISMVKAALAE